MNGIYIIIAIAFISVISSSMYNLNMATECNETLKQYKYINKELLHEYFIQYDSNQAMINKSDSDLKLIDAQQLKIDRLKNSVDDADNRIIDVSEMYNNQIDADRIIVRPTYAEVLEFLAGDHTDLNTHRDAYDCTEFTNELIANARDKGIFACATELSFLDERGHMLVAFNTIDRGIIYIEPQTDDIMTKDFSPGEIYWTNKVLKISSCWEVKT